MFSNAIKLVIAISLDIFSLKVKKKEINFMVGVTIAQFKLKHNLCRKQNLTIVFSVVQSSND